MSVKSCSKLFFTASVLYGYTETSKLGESEFIAQVDFWHVIVMLNR